MTKIAIGSALPASPHRDANALYVSERSLTALRELLDGDTWVAAERGNDITDPATSTGEPPNAIDKVLTLGELDRLDRPANNAALFANERAALPSVHKLFELPSETALTPFAPLETLAYDVQRTLVSAAVTSIAIDALPVTLQASARRLQLVRDSDSVPSTVSRDDIAWAQAAPNRGAFTYPTLADFDAIARFFHDDIVEEKAFGILPPLRQTRTLISAGPVKVDVDAEVRMRVVGRHSSHAFMLVPERQTARVMVEAPAGYKVMIKRTSSVANRQVDFMEQVITGDGTRKTLFDSDPQGGSLWVQIFAPQGALVSNTRVAVPQLELAPFTPPARPHPVAGWRDEAGNAVTDLWRYLRDPDGFGTGVPYTSMP